MQSLTYDGRTRLVWLDTDPDDLDAPTLAEIAAGTDLSLYLVPDSFDPGTANNRVDDSDALSSFDAEGMGTHGSSPSALFKSELVDGSQVAWETLAERLTQGCLLFFESVTEGEEISAGDRCDVYPQAITGAGLRQPVAKNQTRRFKVEWAIGSAPHMNVAVTAS